MYCDVDDCERRAATKIGYCVMHYKRYMRNGTTDRVLRDNSNQTVCDTVFCDEKGPFRNGLCNGCRLRLMRSGTVDRAIAPNGCGSINSNGYILLTVDGKRVYGHRIEAEKMLGRKLKSFEVVHHIDGNTSNNKHSNLKVYTSQSAHMQHHKSEV